MEVIAPNVKGIYFWEPTEFGSIEQMLEKAGRTCYKSEDKITEDSAPKFIRMLRGRGHHAMLEHAFATVVFEADRGFTHELVRHRLCSFGQESTRYCNYAKGKFKEQITVVMQPGLDTEQYKVWEAAMKVSETAYLALLQAGVSPQIARSVLPIGLKAEIVISANLREWMHIFEMRCSKAAHPIMRKLMRETLAFFVGKVPSMYEEQAGRFLNVEEG